MIHVVLFRCPMLTFEQSRVGKSKRTIPRLLRENRPPITQRRREEVDLPLVHGTTRARTQARQQLVALEQHELASPVGVPLAALLLGNGDREALLLLIRVELLDSLE